MLSDRERELLAGIEVALEADDQRLAAAFRSGRQPRERRWLLRALFGFGVLLLVVALLTGTPELFLQGLICLAGAFLWRRWRIARTRDRDGSGDAGAARRTRPGGSPPGWFRPV